MGSTFKPGNYENRAFNQLRQCQQTESVVNYTVAFCVRLLECSDIFDAEALDCYITGLKPTTRDWVLIQDPMSMHQVAKWAETYENTYF